MCECKEDIAEIKAKLAYIIETVESGVAGLAPLLNHPMVKNFIK